MVLPFKYKVHTLYCNKPPAAALTAESILTNELAQGCQQVAAVEGTCCFEVGLVQQRQGDCTRGWSIGPLHVWHSPYRNTVCNEEHFTFQPGLKGHAAQGMTESCALMAHMRVVGHNCLQL